MGDKTLEEAFSQFKVELRQASPGQKEVIMKL